MNKMRWRIGIATGFGLWMGCAGCSPTPRAVAGDGGKSVAPATLPATLPPEVRAERETAQKRSAAEAEVAKRAASDYEDWRKKNNP